MKTRHFSYQFASY